MPPGEEPKKIQNRRLLSDKTFRGMHAPKTLNNKPYYIL